MTYDPDRHHRRSIRLTGYDYTAAGLYYVTIVAQDRECQFGTVVDGVMEPNDAGRMVATIWNELPAFYPGVGVDAFVVMPNHLHGIIVLTAPSPVGAGMSLADVVHRFKTMTTKRYVDGVKTAGWPAFRGRLWQRNYYEHIIRDDPSLDRIRRYVGENPSRWPEDGENPARVRR